MGWRLLISGWLLVGQVAVAYRDELTKRAAHFDVIAFAIFHAGYGPNNFQPFADAFEGWGGAGGSGEAADGTPGRRAHGAGSDPGRPQRRRG